MAPFAASFVLVSYAERLMYIKTSRDTLQSYYTEVGIVYIMLHNTYSLESEPNALVISQVAETSRYIQIDRNDIASQQVVLSARWHQVSVVDANCTDP